MLDFLKSHLARINQKRILDNLIRNGLTIGKNVSIGNDCMIDGYCWLISIGNHVALASKVQIIAHDASTKLFLNHDKVGKVIIGDDVFIGQSSIILPNVTIGNRVLIGAGSVVTKDIPSNSVAVGNPARVKYTLDEYLERNRALIEQRPVYDKSHFQKEGVPQSLKEQMKRDLIDGVGFFK